ncbi:MAG: bifunctional 23S rRNA (guanine(2069)-N(7))-methyltransferase RlmK/23S rRNA (guanine(2445)-N(2))-methyltransferase RlmL [Legionellaceae bacterium]|nr:bifunctional 23S rRNA (guanine(2069)-N(7))-methyltransferase RlmK/23S rRNA (guanine(2445)-N(2))-methyltransferase RlmL [Legionellaceae bacterium]
MTLFSLFVSCPKGLEYLLEDEVRALGLQVTKVSPQGVYGEANLSVIYQLCLWSRLANRVQLILFSGSAGDQQQIYQLCSSYDWQTVFQVDSTLAIDFHGTSPTIRNSMFGAQVVKDAIADYFRKCTQERPIIDRQAPQVRLHAHLKNDVLTVSFDMTGYSLHQRGYRIETGAAPLKENIAAAMLVRAKWLELADTGGGLHDPFCGSGTLVIEAAMMAANVAPGLLRSDQSFLYWTNHDETLWTTLRADAIQQVKPLSIKLQGSDVDSQAIRAAIGNAERAGVSAWIEWTTQAFVDCDQPSTPTGLVICNPPYGERLSDATQLMPVYKQMGQVLHAHYLGWTAAVLTSNPVLARAIGLRATKQYTLYNGAIECKLYCLELSAENQLRSGEYVHKLSENAEMFSNRLKKNFVHLQKWAKRNQISCYRVYDADLPEYAYAIDIYSDHAVLQEYTAPASIPAEIAEKRSQEVIQIVPGLLGLSPQQVVVKQRKRQKGELQYEKMNETRRFMTVTEGSAKLQVNLHDYLDTGLFLDHRLLRMRFGQITPGTRFLNCFCYTATASVHAALAGAFTTNVDLSNTYLNWAKENFKLNRLDISRHQFVQYDCLEWLNSTRDQFDVIFLDPPSFSNSKRMAETLDIQRDHEALIGAAMRLLSPNGTLYFSTNFRQFKLSPQVFDQFSVRDISSETIDLDFKRNQRIHQCFIISDQK